MPAERTKQVGLFGAGAACNPPTAETRRTRANALVVIVFMVAGPVEERCDRPRHQRGGVKKADRRRQGGPRRLARTRKRGSDRSMPRGAGAPFVRFAGSDRTLVHSPRSGLTKASAM